MIVVRDVICEFPKHGDRIIIVFDECGKIVLLISIYYFEFEFTECVYYKVNK